MAVTPGKLVFWITLVLNAGTPVVARQVDVVLLHTSDVRGQILPLPDWERAKHRGGLLRCATLIQQERNRAPNALLLDCGGFLDGSPESWITERRLPMAAAGWLRYDAMLPDAARLANAVPGQAYFAPAVSTVSDASMLSNMRLRGVEPFRVVDVEGVSVAIVALNESSAAHPGRSREQVLADGEDALRHVLRQIREQRPQIVVLVWRFPAGEDREDLARSARLASIFPEIDVILGSGSWKARRQERLHQAILSDAGSQGLYLGRVTLRYDTVRRELVMAEADLLQASHQVEEHDGLRQVLGGDLAQAEVRLNAVVAQNVRALEGTSDRPGQSGIQHLVSLAVQQAADADVVLYAKRSRATLAAGAVRLADLFRIAPARDPWVVMSLVAADLRDLLEENAALLGSAAFLGCHGVTYEFHEGAVPGRRVLNLRLADGQKPHGRKRLRVLLPAQVIDQDGPGRVVAQKLAGQPINRLVRLDIDTQSALVDYMKNVESLDLHTRKGIVLRTP